MEATSAFRRTSLGRRTHLTTVRWSGSARGNNLRGRQWRYVLGSDLPFLGVKSLARRVDAKILTSSRLFVGVLAAQGEIQVTRSGTLRLTWDNLGAPWRLERRLTYAVWLTRWHPQLQPARREEWGPTRALAAASYIYFCPLARPQCPHTALLRHPVTYST